MIMVITREYGLHKGGGWKGGGRGGGGKLNGLRGTTERQKNAV